MVRARKWHHQDIVAELRKRGSSLAALSRANGYSSRTLQCCLHKPWPRGNAIIASFLGMTRHQIWPAWYGPDDQPLPRTKRAGTPPLKAGA